MTLTSPAATATDFDIDDSGIIALPTPRGIPIEPELDGYVVVDCYGQERPFNKGLLATGILATGAETPDAYAIALEVQQHLFKHHITRIDSADLVILTAAKIANQLSRHMADSYQAWNKAKALGRPLIVALTGAPGIGKSTLATRLAIRLMVNQVVTTDATREILRTIIPAQILPELHRSILDSGEAQAVTYARQTEAVSAACASVAQRSVRDGKPILFEGTHLLPGALTRALRSHPDSPIVVERVLYLNDKDMHARHQALHGRAVRGDADGRAAARFEASCELQQQMRSLAAQAGIREFEIGGRGNITQAIVQEYVEQALA